MNSNELQDLVASAAALPESRASLERQLDAFFLWIGTSLKQTDGERILLPSGYSLFTWVNGDYQLAKLFGEDGPALRITQTEKSIRDLDLLIGDIQAGWLEEILVELADHVRRFQETERSVASAMENTDA